MGGAGSGRRAADGIRRRSVGDIPSIVLADLVGGTAPELGDELRREWVLPGQRVTATLERVRPNTFSCTLTAEALDGRKWSRVHALPLASIGKNYGGVEFYLICTRSDCSRPAKTLYLDKLELLCRRCAKLAYPSQRRTPIERRRARLAEVRRLLGVPPAERAVRLRRPRGMRQRRFEELRGECRRLEGELEAAEEARLRDLLARLKRGHRLPRARKRGIPNSEPKHASLREYVYWELKYGVGAEEEERAPSE